MASKSEVKELKSKIEELEEQIKKKDLVMILCLDLLKDQYTGIRDYVEAGNENDLFPMSYFGDLRNLFEKVKANIPENMAADRFKGILD